MAITKRRTMQDFARQMRGLVDEAYPDIPVLRVVLDNLNTHRTSSLYETFPVLEARRIAKRLEFHHTPKHGSWLNIPGPSGGRGRRSSQRAGPGLPTGTQRRRGQIGSSRTGLRVRTQQPRGHHQLALHCRGLPNQAQTSLLLLFLI